MTNENMVFDEELVGEMTVEEAQALVGKQVYIEFSYDVYGFNGTVEDVYEDEVMHIVIKLENGEFETRELHEVSFFEEK